MTVAELLTFAGALCLMVITPGPGVLACVSRALTSGFRMAVFVSMGIIVGDIFFLLMALYGLSAIAELLGSFFEIVRFGGAVYLIWLGYCTWTSNIDLKSIKSVKAVSARNCFVSGLTLTLGNPKAIVFYLSLLPAFLDPTRLSGSDVVVTAAVVVFILAIVLSAYSFAANKVRNMIRNRRAIKRINRCAGAIMISTGVTIAVRD